MILSIRGLVNFIVQRRLPEHTEEAEADAQRARERLNEAVDDLLRKLTDKRNVNGLRR